MQVGFPAFRQISKFGEQEAVPTVRGTANIKYNTRISSQRAGVKAAGQYDGQAVFMGFNGMSYNDNSN